MLVGLALVLAVCQSTPVVGGASLPDGAVIATASKVACPSQDFNPFLVAFANDANSQKAFTANPLTLAYLMSTDVGFEVKNGSANPHEQKKTYFYPRINRVSVEIV